MSVQEVPQATIFWGDKDADGQGVVFKPPENRDELRTFLHSYFGVTFPEKAYCPDHSAPFDVLASAYFAEEPMQVWKASRGLAGKTFMLAALSLVELLAGYDVVLLAGTGEQSQRAHAATEENWSSRVFVWMCPNCRKAVYESLTSCDRCGRACPENPHKAQLNKPDFMLKKSPLKTRTLNVFGNEMTALTASTRSVRGPHPQRLRMDEVDEMDLKILDAAMGQTLYIDDKMPTQTVFASTHHNEQGAMTEVIKRAKKHNWPVHEWCYKETLVRPDNPGSWLRLENIEEKKQQTTDYMWNVEYDLDTPDEGGAIFPRSVLERFFSQQAEWADKTNKYFELEAPQEGGVYITGADWGKKTDLSVIVTFRVDVEPWKCVAIERLHKRGWTHARARFDWRRERYPGRGIHDGTGYGDVINEMLEIPGSYAFEMNSAERYSRLFFNYELAAQEGFFVLPRGEGLYAAHQYTQRGDLTWGVPGHPPDEVVACSMAILMALGLHNKDSKKKPGRVVRPRYV